MTWTTLAVIAIGGANTGIKVFDMIRGPENAIVTKVALTTIAAAAPYLDYLGRARGHIYSFPKNIKTSCDYGKPYHFWMTAFLAYRLTKENGNVPAAAAAAYISQIGYQMKSTTAGRDPDFIFAK